MTECDEDVSRLCVYGWGEKAGILSPRGRLASSCLGIGRNGSEFWECSGKGLLSQRLLRYTECHSCNSLCAFIFSQTNERGGTVS